MDKIKKIIDFLGNVVAVIYFFTAMMIVLFLLGGGPFMLISNIDVIRESGFANPNSGQAIMGLSGLFIGISLLIPPLRKMYYKLPWLFPFTKILFVDVLILSIAVAILNYGYEIQSSSRHAIFFGLMIGQIIIGRALMCIYFNKNKVEYIGGEAHE